jgi:hypothetical protein
MLNRDRARNAILERHNRDLFIGFQSEVFSTRQSAFLFWLNLRIALGAIPE